MRWLLLGGVVWVGACAPADAPDEAVRRDALVTEVFGWVQLAQVSMTPPPRWSPLMVYDRVRREVILFGGTDGTTVFNDTWRYAAGRWTPLTPATSPPARSAPGSAWDEARGVVVMISGLGTPGTYLADAWEWNGTTWTDVTPQTQPAARAGAVAFFDTASGTVVYASGFNGTRYGDTWRWNGAAFTSVPSTLSPTRSVAAATATSTRVVLFGGFTPSGAAADTWAYSASTWAVLSPPQTPPARSGHGLVWDSYRSSALLYGGMAANGTILGDAWEWNEATWASRVFATPNPGARDQFGYVFDPNRNEYVLFGGRTPAITAYGDTWVLSVRRTNDSTCTSPLQCQSGYCAMTCLPMPVDAGAVDAGDDAGSDAGAAADAGVRPDAGVVIDSGVVTDSGVADAGEPDAGAPDAGVVVPDAGVDAGARFDGGAATSDAGVGDGEGAPSRRELRVGCTAVSGEPWLWLAAFALLRRQWPCARSSATTSR